MFRIQYAKIVRWKPPIDLASEKFPNGSFEATSFGACCPQPPFPIYISPQDEQCLYLNIFQPILPTNHSLVPVFVWVHGGGHKIACSSQGIPLLFNGSNMITHSPPDQPVIIVSINYRLGVFADMYLNELIEEDPEWPTAGNYMYLDMLSSLRWVKKNIQDYGGDPNNVSIFGQSAGGLSVTDLGAVRGSAGLYRAALSESGLGSPGTYSSYYSMSNALDYSTSVVQRLNCTNGDKQQVLACLRNCSVQSVLDAYVGRGTKPIIDNHFFPLYPPLAIQNGTYNNISLIMGNNDYEQSTCSQHPDMNFTDALNIVTELVGQKWSSAVVDYYHLNNCSSDRNANSSRCCEIIRLITMDKIFDCDIRRIFDAFYSKYGPQNENNKLFSYHLNCYPTCPHVPNQGVCEHTSELPFVFGTESDVNSKGPLSCTWDNQTREFSNKILSHWINVATTGRPLSSWPSYDPTAPKYFQITPDQDFFPVTWNRNCSFFDAIEAENAREIFQNNA